VSKGIRTKVELGSQSTDYTKQGSTEGHCNVEEGMTVGNGCKPNEPLSALASKYTSKRKPGTQ
jgi:hypothetical protein